MNIIKSKRQMFIVIGAFALILLLGTASYAFFNYTRTGLANNINTGKINFQSTQTQNPVTVSNLFPIKAADIPTSATTFNASTSKFARVIVHVEGETTWEEGIDYVVSAIDTNLQVGTSLNKLPLKVHVYESTDPQTHTGDLTGDTLTLPYETAGTLTEGKVTLASGHIAGNSTYGNGMRYKRDIVIDAYILASDIAITDTPEESSEWVNGRTIYSTAEWNALATSGASFKIIVESNETQPTPAPAAGSIASCPGCKFMYTNNYYDFGDTVDEIEENGDVLYDDYNDLYRSFFLGLKIENDEIVKAYACGAGMFGGAVGSRPFCIEGAGNDSSIGDANKVVLNTFEDDWDSCSDVDEYAFQCFEDNYSGTGYMAVTDRYGLVRVGEWNYGTSWDEENWYCHVDIYDGIYCNN